MTTKDFESSVMNEGIDLSIQERAMPTLKSPPTLRK